MRIGRAGRLWLAMMALVGAVALASAGPALASVPASLKSSPLPGYPRFRGVIAVHNGSVASRAREKAIESAVTRAGAEGPPRSAPSLTTSTTKPDCQPYLEGGEGEYPGADLCWWGGPVLSEDTVHLIFWEEPGVHEISPEYKKTIEEYFENVAAASGAGTNVYAVGTQYGGAYEGKSLSGKYKVSFSASKDVYVDVESLPASGSSPAQCKDPAEAAEAGVCVTDENLREQVAEAIKAKESEGWGESLREIYFVYTPEKVGGCFYDNEEAEAEGGNECAFETYCAYHSALGESGEVGLPPEYADIPDIGGVEGCDSFEYPNEPEGVDAVLDATSHEHSETITDPLFDGWFDLIGQEIGDKCLPPETFETYGEPLEGLSAYYNEFEEIVPGTLFNQEIGSGKYWLQTEWSNRANFGEGRCVQRMVPTEFPEPSNAQATVPTTFEGMPSGEASDPAAYWVWSFGDGIQVGTPEQTVSHTYGTAGTYTVRLTVYDAYGNSNTFTRNVTVGAAPPPSPPSPPPSPVTTTTTTTTSVTSTQTVNVPVEAKVSRYTPKSVEKSLHLPHNGAKLPGLGRIALGQAKCPPACGITVTVRSSRRGHGRSPVIGRLKETIANNGTGSIALTLNGRGRRLLRKQRHGLHVTVKVVVEDREGATWSFARKLRLTNTRAHASRRHRHRRRR